ncbi:MAG: alpha/beta fold hydrolase [Rhodospirillales bacterium]|nr:alpha/beta fold hydrolase [Rhodospirillales bacterium]
MSHAVLEHLQRSARRTETPCGAGHMVWHEWGEGPALVLLHGGSGSWRHWVRNIPHFAAHRRVIAPDLPGLGLSSMPPEPEDARAMAAILADGLARLVEPRDRYDLAGFSFGGVMASCLAAREGRRVRTLTIVG